MTKNNNSLAAWTDFDLFQVRRATGSRFLYIFMPKTAELFSLP